jgi:hypothetical protein
MEVPTQNKRSLGTPASVPEGVTASKGFIDFFNPTTGNTVFHIARTKVRSTEGHP